MAPLRQALDEAGGTAKLLVLALDGSFCNRTCFRAPRDRTELIARARKDARLCFRAPQPSPRFYALSPFTPEQVRQDESLPWKQTKLFYGGKRRRIRYKEVTQVYWRRGAGQIPLRLFVVAPTPYRKRKSSKLYYRQPAYLLSTDLRHSAPQLLQIYFDRWQIEVNHRDEKDTLGVGQAQLWNIDAVPKQPALVVAAYSALLLAALQAFGTATRRGLSGPAQLATQGPPPFLPRPGHPAAPRNGRPPGMPPIPRLPTHRPRPHPRRRRVKNVETPGTGGTPVARRLCHGHLGHACRTGGTPVTRRRVTSHHATTDPLPVLQAGPYGISEDVLHLILEVLLIPNQVVVRFWLPELARPSDQAVRFLRGERFPRMHNSRKLKTW